MHLNFRKQKIMNVVEPIEMDATIDINKTSTGNVETVQSALESIRTKCLFSDIADPVAYQKQLRDEWR